LALACPSGPAPLTWALTTPAGSAAQYEITLTLADGITPYPIGGATWEYVVRISAGDTGTPLLSITTVPSSAGVITVETSPESVVTLTLYPAATAAIYGTYRHSLWMNPGTPQAFAFILGSLVAAAAPQP
jgi:hypothetical protein